MFEEVRLRIISVFKGKNRGALSIIFECLQNLENKRNTEN